MKATIEGLPKLELIIAMGNVAYRSLRLADNRLNGDWRNLVENKTVCDANLFGKAVKVAAVLHPGPLAGGQNVPVGGAELFEAGLKTALKQREGEHQPLG